MNFWKGCLPSDIDDGSGPVTSSAVSDKKTAEIASTLNIEVVENWNIFTMICYLEFSGQCIERYDIFCKRYRNWIEMADCRVHLRDGFPCSRWWIWPSDTTWKLYIYVLSLQRYKVDKNWKCVAKVMVKFIRDVTIWTLWELNQWPKQKFATSDVLI